MKLRIAQIKVEPVKRDVRANAGRLMELLEQIRARGADVVVTPECFLDGYCSVDPAVTASDLCGCAIDPERSPDVKAIRAWCRGARAWCILGCTRHAGSAAGAGGVYNSALVIDREGQLAGIYDKTHLQGHDLKYLPGRRLAVFAGDFGPFGVMICADRRWPETSRSLALQGARIIFNPTFGFHNELNVAMMRTRAYESELFIVFTHPAQSLITGPCGQVVLNEERPEVAFAITDVDLAEVDETRANGERHLRDRRAELYFGGAAGGAAGRT